MADKVKEKYLWQWLKRLKKIEKTNLQMERIENSVGRSNPDVEGCHAHFGQFWIELKTGAWPKRQTTLIKPKFSIGQPEWLYRRWQIGGSSWVIFQIGVEKESIRYLFPGSVAMELAGGVSRKKLDALGVRISKVEELFDRMSEISSWMRN